jgi:predicted ATPase
MLKSIKVPGYKSLQDSAAHFQPFTVIVGKNNVGKSNMFDALHLLSDLSHMPAASAFKPERHRGDPVESFFSDQSPQLTITCEFDLSGTPHPFASDSKLSHRLLSYDVEIVFKKGMLEVAAEKLKGRTHDGSRPRSFISMEKDGKPRVAVNRDTAIMEKDGKPRVAVNRDTAISGKSRHFPAPSGRSVLTMIDDAELYPHVVALARELSSWRFFHFEPEALREASPAMDILELEPNGRGLSGFYDTLSNHNPDRFQSAERALRRGIPEAHGIRVLDTGDRRRLLAVVRDDDREFTARVLSDGTLRFLALIALAYAPQPPGLVCFEEPENGVHPGRLPFIVDTLRGISQRGSEGGRRSQVLVNSHSPYLVDLLDPAEMLVASLSSKSQTRFASVGEDMFTGRPALKGFLESGEQTLGELWSQGSFDADS